ncbi:hypothetical protein OPV22_029352 [Ensete ventricosum]|uniref:Secreted protein n=1 Tax=Ensete ventricosum TaxID=4639 RepID=A0AAV8PXA2_ENSVE|nr:hypothetical protein OPV22_029352 [Ensete ventricosum]
MALRKHQPDVVSPVLLWAWQVALCLGQWVGDTSCQGSPSSASLIQATTLFQVSQIHSNPAASYRRALRPNLNLVRRHDRLDLVPCFCLRAAVHERKGLCWGTTSFLKFYAHLRWTGSFLYAEAKLEDAHIG